MAQIAQETTREVLDQRDEYAAQLGETLARLEMLEMLMVDDEVWDSQKETENV